MTKCTKCSGAGRIVPQDFAGWSTGGAGYLTTSGEPQACVWCTGTGEEPTRECLAARELLGARAEREGWDMGRCRAAAQARVEIASGIDAAGTWARAIYGSTGEGAHLAEYVAHMGVRDADGARARWRERLDALRGLATGPA